MFIRNFLVVDIVQKEDRKGSFYRYRHILSKASSWFVRRTPYYSEYIETGTNRPLSLRILTDEIEYSPVEPDKEFSFEKYSDVVVAIINGSYQRFSVGIYGEWGSGKTTLMRLIEKKLRPRIFCWEDVPGKDSKHLLTYIKDNFESVAAWAGTITETEIMKSADKKRIILNNSINHNNLSLAIADNERINIEINGNKVSELAVEELGHEKRIYAVENNVLTIWFNAWRYEREDQFALIPLLKTIAYAMGQHPIYKDIKPILLRGLEIFSKDILRNLATKYILTEKGFDEFETKLVSKMEKLPELDKDTIYFDGMKKLEEEIHRISNKYRRSRVVVFIDDLDRCSPDTTIQVFESIMLFLDIDGFIFIVGLSREALDKLIKKKFENIGLADITAEEYIRKIIQIEINIQKWKDYAIRNLIKKLAERVDEKYRDSVRSNIDLIARGVELNPRQVKRFMNRLIVALSANPALNPHRYLVFEVLASRWPDVYINIDSPEFFKLLKKVAQSDYEQRTAFFLELEAKAKTDQAALTGYEKVILSRSQDAALWDFLAVYKNTVIPMGEQVPQELQMYERASKATEIPSNLVVSIFLCRLKKP